MMARALALAEKGPVHRDAQPARRLRPHAGRGASSARAGTKRPAAPHAEVAGARAGRARRPRARRVYVTLEPCNHHGRTPPCVEALIAGKGRARRRGHARPESRRRRTAARSSPPPASRFESGLLEDEARELNIGFVSRMTRGRPWVRMKIAATLDGRTALANGKSQWITGPEARRDGHRWRARACAIAHRRRHGEGRRPAAHGARGRDAAPAAARGGRQPTGDAARRESAARASRTLVFAAIERRVAAERGDRRAAERAAARWTCRRCSTSSRAAASTSCTSRPASRLNGSLVREGCVDEFLIYLNPSLLGDAAQGMVDLRGDGLARRASAAEDRVARAHRRRHPHPREALMFTGIVQAVGRIVSVAPARGRRRPPAARGRAASATRSACRALPHRGEEARQGGSGSTSRRRPCACTDRARPRRAGEPGKVAAPRRPPRRPPRHRPRGRRRALVPEEGQRLHLPRAQGGWRATSRARARSASTA